MALIEKTIREAVAQNLLPGVKIYGRAATHNLLGPDGCLTETELEAVWSNPAASLASAHRSRYVIY
jgi:hypothetical protein